MPSPLNKCPSWETNFYIRAPYNFSSKYLKSFNTSMCSFSVLELHKFINIYVESLMETSRIKRWQSWYFCCFLMAYNFFSSKQGWIQTEMVVFKHYGCPRKCPQKWRKEKENCCLLINFSSKQWASLCSVQKNTLHS